MVHVLRVELAVSRVGLGIDASIRQVVPAGLGLVSKKHVAAIVPLEPSPHFLRQRPNMLVIGPLVQPVVQGSLKIGGVRIDLTWELALQSWNHIVECEGIR